MALDAGDNEASKGMAKAIFHTLRKELEPEFPCGEAPTETLRAWKKLSFALATGVIDHIIEAMEIHSIHSSGTTGDEPITVKQTDETTGKVK